MSVQGSSLQPGLMMLLLSLALVGSAATAARRPQVKGGYDCSQGCGKSGKTHLPCLTDDFRWDLIDMLHWHPGLRTTANGSLAWDEKSGGADACDPTHTSTNNHSAFVKFVREQHNVTILQQLQPPKLQADLWHLFNDKPSRKAAIQAACQAVTRIGFDGISVDFEGPWRSNVTFRPGLTRFIKELKSAASKLRRPPPHHASPLLVTAAVAHDMDYDVAQDFPALAEVSDGLLTMTYDYLFAAKTGLNALSRSDTPMYHSKHDPEDPPTPNNNINSSIQAALTQGVPAHKLTMCIAWYGKEVPTVSGNMGALMNISDATADPELGRPQRMFNYQQPLSENRSITVGGGSQWDSVALTPWYRWQDPKRPWLWWQGFYDDARSLRYKYQMVKDLRLDGVLLWQLNACDVKKAPELWKGLEEAFGTRAGY